MGAEWPAGAALAMETWPARSRGLMGGILQGSWGIGFLLSSAVYGLFFNYIGWRGMLWIGVLPAVVVLWVRRYVKEPEVWAENRRRQRVEHREVHAPLFSIFKRGLLGNTLTACWWMASGFVTYYSINALFATHLQKELGLSPAMVATPIALANIAVFAASGWWGWVSDRIGRRWAMIIPALIAIPVAPLYLLTDDLTWIAIGFIIQGMCGGGGMQGQMPPYLAERFPTEVRATASAFCFHQGAIWGGLVPLVLSFFAVHYDLGFAIPMMVGTCVGGAQLCLRIAGQPRDQRKGAGAGSAGGLNGTKRAIFVLGDLRLRDVRSKEGRICVRHRAMAAQIPVPGIVLLVDAALRLARDLERARERGCTP